MIQITSLCDNVNNSKGLWSVEGNSLLINAFGVSLLFDVGRSAEILQHNLDQLKLNLNDFSAIILSHGHMGHVGAIRKMLLHSSVPVYYGKDFGLPKVKYKNGSFLRVKNEELLFDAQKMFDTVEVENVIELVDHKVYLFKTLDGSISDADEKYFVSSEKQYVPDAFSEELNLCIKSSQGLILLSGCAHRGVENLIQTAIKIFKDDRIYAILGGTHIFNDIEKTHSYIELVKRYDVSIVAPSHCTGIFARARIAEKLADRFISLTTGESIFLEE